MKTANRSGSLRSMVEEFDAAPLGNQLRNRRLDRIVRSVCRAPWKSFPRLLSAQAELEGFYRFVRGEGYTAADIMEPHVQRTAERAAAEPIALVAHDTSEFGFSGESRREGLGRLRGQDQGFLGHFSLALSLQRRPLGVLAMQQWVRTGPGRSRKDGKRRSGSDYAKETEKESTRWWTGVQEAEARVEGSLIHLMDREGDAYPLLAQMSEAGYRFVVRLARDRVATAEMILSPNTHVSDVLTCAEIRAEREVPLSRRKAESAPRSRNFVSREGRVARLSIRAMPMALQRPNYAGAALPKWLPVNVIHVVETDPPEGEKPVEWTLLTTEPIETERDALAVVDYYRARWTIEEYFKALKQGCSVEERQLESYETLSKALAIFVPVAWKLLELRTLARTSPASAATEVLTPTQLDVLNACGPLPLPANPTVRDALLAVAKLGGHIKNNGQPGWQVLGRGLEELLTLEVGWLAARAAAKRDQS
jgi:hypothetical protein